MLAEAKPVAAVLGRAVAKVVPHHQAAAIAAVAHSTMAVDQGPPSLVQQARQAAAARAVARQHPHLPRAAEQVVAALHPTLPVAVPILAARPRAAAALQVLRPVPAAA